MVPTVATRWNRVAPSPTLSPQVEASQAPTMPGSSGGTPSIDLGLTLFPAFRSLQATPSLQRFGLGTRTAITLGLRLRVCISRTTQRGMRQQSSLQNLPASHSTAALQNGYSSGHQMEVVDIPTSRISGR